jgi:hypothetical protein
MLERSFASPARPFRGRTGETTFGVMNTIETGKVDHPMVVDEDVTLAGMAARGVVVRPKATLMVHGIVSGGVVLEESSRLVLTGTGSGLFNVGPDAVLEIMGSFKGSFDHQDGTVLVHTGALIHEGERSRRVTADGRLEWLDAESPMHDVQEGGPVFRWLLEGDTLVPVQAAGVH